MRKYLRSDFAPLGILQNTQILADLLPTGTVFATKNINSSNFRKTLTGLSGETDRLEKKIYELSTEYFPDKTINLLERWEKALGIPDDCFKIEGADLEDRRKYVIAKLALMNVQTKTDFVELAKFLGYNIQILYPEVYATFPLKLPFLLGDEAFIRFTIIVKFLDLEAPTSVFPLELPFKLGGIPEIIRCLFIKLLPIHINAIFVDKSFAPYG